MPLSTAERSRRYRQRQKLKPRLQGHMIDPGQWVYYLARYTARTEGGCLVWTGHVYKGYARLTIRGVSYNVHKLALERKLGRGIKPGYEAHHTCQCPYCVFEDHLQELSEQDHQQLHANRHKRYQKAA